MTWNSRTLMAVLLLMPALPGMPRAAAAQEIRRIVPAGTDTIAFSDRGTGPAVVLVPGLLGSRHTFRHVERELLATGHRVLAIDPLGTGSSARPKRSDYSLEAQAQRIGAVLDDVGLERAVFACHSVGASMCMRFALQQPARVSGLVSINGGPDERAATGGLRMAMRFAPLIRVMGAGSMRGRVKDGLKGTAGPAATWVTDENVNAYTAPFSNLGASLDALKGMAGAREPVALAPRLPQLAAPVVLLVGAGNRDGGVAAADLATLTRTLPSLRIDSIHDAGQYIQEERPDAIVAAIRSLTRR